MKNDEFSLFINYSIDKYNYLLIKIICTFIVYPFNVRLKLFVKINYLHVFREKKYFKTPHIGFKFILLIL